MFPRQSHGGPINFVVFFTCNKKCMSPCSEKGAHLIFQHTGSRLFNGQFSLQNPFTICVSGNFMFCFALRGWSRWLTLITLAFFVFKMCDMYVDSRCKPKKTAKRLQILEIWCCWFLTLMCCPIGFDMAFAKVTNECLSIIGLCCFGFHDVNSIFFWQVDVGSQCAVYTKIHLVQTKQN